MEKNVRKCEQNWHFYFWFKMIKCSKNTQIIDKNCFVPNKVWPAYKSNWILAKLCPTFLDLYASLYGMEIIRKNVFYLPGKYSSNIRWRINGLVEIELKRLFLANSFIEETPASNAVRQSVFAMTNIRSKSSIFEIILDLFFSQLLSFIFFAINCLFSSKQSYKKKFVSKSDLIVHKLFDGAILAFNLNSYYVVN